jgi:23S rRNA pseudouridine1911/1915/1917 synthase
VIVQKPSSSPGERETSPRAILSQALIKLTVGATRQAMRLDQFIAAAMAPEYSRSRVARMIKAGLVTVNGSSARASAALRAGDRVEIAAPPRVEAPPPSEFAPAIEVIHSDAELIVVNKRAGMTVHQAPGHPDGTLVDALMARFPELAAMAEPDGVMRPGIVHRLDKDTSGVMVVARTPFARMSLARQFKDRAVRKIYLAIVRGIVGPDRMTIARPLGRHPVERKRMSVSSRNPREAISYVGVLMRFPGNLPATLVRVRPETGRTHQIRVHLASAGHPCLGDPLYGRTKTAADAAAFGDRQALHALALTINHPRTDERLEFVAPLPEDMTVFLTARGVFADARATRGWIDAPSS